MKQVIHIFLKDVRHFWRECAVSLLLAGVFAWGEVRQWGQPEWASTHFSGLLNVRFWATCAEVLLPALWVFLLVRVIQADSLVGDRQFWITRPLDWKKLLAAKVLFVFAFVSVPLLVLDCFLLWRAQFSPAHHALGLLWMQVLLVLFMLLPFAALATVTRNLGHLLLALLAAAVYMIGMALLSDKVPNSSFSGPVDTVYTILLIATAATVLVLQYARRRTGHSRLLIVALGTAFLLLLVATPYKSLVAHEFPNLNQAERRPFEIALLVPEKRAAAADSGEKDVEVRLPLAVSSIARDEIVNIDGIRLEMESPQEWDSGWKSPGLLFYPETRKAEVSFTFKKKDFDRLAAAPARARIDIAFSQFRDGQSVPFVVPPGRFELSGLGHCFNSIYSRQITCLTPLRTPSSLLVTTDMSQSTCPLLERESAAKPGELARGWIRNSDSAPADFGISPINTVNVFLSASSPSTNWRSAGVCPGTPVILSSPHKISQGQVSLDFDNVRLTNYQIGDLSGGVVFGIRY